MSVYVWARRRDTEREFHLWQRYVDDRGTVYAAIVLMHIIPDLVLRVVTRTLCTPLRACMT